MQITFPSITIPPVSIPGTTLTIPSINFSDTFIGNGTTIPVDIKPIFFSSKFTGSGLTVTDPIDITIPSGTDPKVLPYVEKTANYTITLNDYTVNCLTNSFTVTLPSAVGIQGRVFLIKNSTIGTSITVRSAVAGQTIDDVAAKVLTSRTPLKVQSTGSKYIIIY